MKYTWIIVLLSAAVVLAIIYGWAERTTNQAFNTRSVNVQTHMPESPKAKKTNMTLSSPAFTDGAMIPPRYTCDAANISGGAAAAAHPPLTFSGVPAQAKSLVLTMDDPDVPRDLVPLGVFDHWVLYNIPPKTTGIADGAETALASDIPGTPGMNSAGQAAYAGPCPPDREHRYFFRLYALDTQLAIKKGASKAEVLEAMEGHVIAEAELMGRYDKIKASN